MPTEIGEIKVTADGQFVRAIPAEFIPVPFGRGSPIGMTGEGTFTLHLRRKVPGSKVPYCVRRMVDEVGQRNGSIGGSFSTILPGGIRCSSAFGRTGGQCETNRSEF